MNEMETVNQYVLALKKAMKEGYEGRFFGNSPHNESYWYIRENIPKNFLISVIKNIDVITDKTVDEKFWASVCHPHILVEDVHGS